MALDTNPLIPAPCVYNLFNTGVSLVPSTPPPLECERQPSQTSRKAEKGEAALQCAACAQMWLNVQAYFDWFVLL